MESKYYTPEIEKFHVGFEYETSYLQDYNTWKKEILLEDDAGYFHSIYFGDAVSTEFRIKYLDQEDIESLGWKEKSRKYYIIELPGSYPYHLYAILDFRFGLDDITIDVIRSYEYRNEDEDQRIFRGIIKNKSELIRLMKQLKING